MVDGGAPLIQYYLGVIVTVINSDSVPSLVVDHSILLRCTEITPVTAIMARTRKPTERALQVTTSFGRSLPRWN